MVVVWTFGVVKSRCISISGGVLKYSPALVADVILACCVLYNMATCEGIEVDLDGLKGDDELTASEMDPDQPGNVMQPRVIQTYFAW